MVEHCFGSGGVNLDEFLKVDFWEMILRTTFAFIVTSHPCAVYGEKTNLSTNILPLCNGYHNWFYRSKYRGRIQNAIFGWNYFDDLWAVLTMLMSYIAFKSKKARILLDDQPTIVVYEGKIVEASLKKTRLHLNDLSMMLREQSIFSVKDVHYAILETNGK